MLDLKKTVAMMREKGLGVAEMAEAAETEKENMRDILWGRATPKVIVMCKIARKLGVGIEEIWNF